MNKLKNFWNGCVLNPWSYALLGIVLVVAVVGIFLMLVLLIGVISAYKFLSILISL